MKKTLLFFLLFAAACSSDDEVVTPAPLPVTGNKLVISFSPSSIDITKVDSAYALLTNGSVSIKRYFEKSSNSLVVSLDDLTGTWDSQLFLYTKASSNDFARQYLRDKAFIVNGQPIIQQAPNGSIIDTWFPRILVQDSDVSFLVGLAPEDPLFRLEVLAADKWDYFSISKTVFFRNGNSVLVGSKLFEVFEPIQPPGISNSTELDLVPEIGEQLWNEIEIYATLIDLDGEGEERPLYYRISL